MLFTLNPVAWVIMRKFIIATIIFFYSSTTPAVESLEIQGLFANKAVLMIDGKRHILAVGETSPEGVKIVSADAHGAVVEIAGKQKHYDLGNTVSTVFEKRKSTSEKIYANSGGMYMTYGNINGRSVHFLVDTGASAIAMSAEQAKMLGIRYDKFGEASSVSTASGFEKAFRVQLKSVSVGTITQTNVEAFVIEGSHPGPILLGMTFLGNLNVEHSGTAMTLRQKN